MSEHTDGPLDFEGDELVSAYGTHIARVLGIAGLRQANIRRLAACWNALGRYSTEEIESGLFELKESK